MKRPTRSVGSAVAAAINADEVCASWVHVALRGVSCWLMQAV